ncbi:MAG: FGGY family carbohydrate kinase [Gaiellaceae bacterium]
MILAIDQGTTGTTCLVVDEELRIRGRGSAELPQQFPRPGWVEHDPERIWQSVLAAAHAALRGIRPGELRAIGIANQRETTLLWERRSGRPVHNAIVWQDRRTAERCRALPAELLRERTGLVADPYFSATKIEWLLERTASAEPLAFGTVDTWLVWKLTGGRVHVTDETNASRTLLVSLASLDWDDELLGLFGVPRDLLPAIRPSSGVVGETGLFGPTLPIAGIAGDQQAALFAAGGTAKATYGTGSFVLAPSLSDCSPPPHGLVRTAAARLEGRPPQYALEGSVFVTGAAVHWLRDGLGLIGEAAETEALAASLDSNAGVYFVPALAGLGSPHWTPDARGLICGLTRGTRREHLARAALEAAAYQTCDVLEAMPGELELLRADGGMTGNAFLMQFQADLLRIPVEVAAEREQTALGAALLAGTAVGLWPAPPPSPVGARYEPGAAQEEAYAGWQDALRRATVS